MKTKADKQNQAIERQESYGKLTPQQKIDKLDAKLGKGEGARKERMKLTAKQK